MAQTISATDTELPKPVNVVFQQTLLRNAKPKCPYFLGTMPGELMKNRGTATVSWRRIENLTPTTSALTELTTTASYMQGRDSTALSVTAYTATVAKYGQFVILNEEADVFNFNGQTDKIVEVLGISAGRSMNQLQRNIVEDNATLVYAGGAASDGAVTSKITLGAIKSVVNTLDKNSAITFTPMSTGSQNYGTTQLMDGYVGLTHPDVAVDITELAGFKPAETYAGQVALFKGEFGSLTVAGKTVRFISSEDASVDADAGGTKGSTGLNGTSDVDLYTTCIYGRDAIGSVGFGDTFPDGSFMAGDDLSAIELIVKGLGSGGTSDPYNEVMTMAWKGWHTGTILNANWVRGVRSGSTALS